MDAATFDAKLAELKKLAGEIAENQERAERGRRDVSRAELALSELEPKRTALAAEIATLMGVKPSDLAHHQRDQRGEAVD